MWVAKMCYMVKQAENDEESLSSNDSDFSSLSDSDMIFQSIMTRNALAGYQQ